MDNNETLDNENKNAAPVLYSPIVIIWFSILFSPIFGCILLAMNLPQKEAKWRCIFAGVAYTIICSVIVNLLALPSYASIASSVGGGYFLISLFWNRYIGSETAYLPRSITAPVVVGLTITIAVIALVLLVAKLSPGTPVI